MPDSLTPCTPISGPEVRDISAHGFRLHLRGQDFHLAYRDFPWLKGASADVLAEVTEPRPGHLRWPALDVDLTIASIENPAAYPLVSRIPSTVRERPKTPGSD
jgi:hypothetical protein